MTTTIKLSEGQFLSNIEPFKSSGIPNGCILYKEVPGCGATESELRSERNSIIVVPHQPVIKDKVRAWNKSNPASMAILGVLKGVDVYQIENYLNSTATYKKILTTPEGFAKILDVFANDMETLYAEYFLLPDECERIITDVNYRRRIAAPIDEFELFENKALVSATPLEFTHPALAKLDKILIEPIYNYQRHIDVIGTNSVVDSLKQRLDSLKSNNPIFLFINSTSCILDIIDILNIRNESFVYCGEKSVAQLLSSRYDRASHKLELNSLDKYVFLTSRYFCALDIKLDFKPDVIMVTDVYTADHSTLDPLTDIIQIPGRFRNGINSLTHITNFKPELESKSYDEAKAYLTGVFDTHNQVVGLLKRLDTESSSNVLEFFLDESFTSDYYTKAGHVNDFMIDNYIYEQRVKGYYQRFENLIAAYNVKPKHFNVTILTEGYEIGDKDRVYRKSRLSIKERQRETFRQLDKLEPNKPGKFLIHNSYDLIRNLRSLYPQLTRIYDLIGFDGMTKANFKQSAMTKYAKSAQEIKDIKSLQPFIYNEFAAHSERHDEEIRTLIPALCTEANVKSKATITMLSKFFETKRTTNGGQHITIIGEKRDLSNLSPFD